LNNLHKFNQILCNQKKSPDLILAVKLQDT